MNDTIKSVKPSLGRGLSVLLGDMPESTSPYRNVSIQQIFPSPLQPRQDFDEETLNGLAVSIKENGILQPLLVRYHEDKDSFELIAGERRWRAAKKIGLDTVPVIVLSMDDAAVLESSIIENIQREDISLLEEAEAYQRLMKDFNYTQEKISQALGKSRSHVANILRLLQLPETVKKYLKDKRISFGHAKILIGNDNIETIAEKIVTENLNVRDTEKLIRKSAANKNRNAKIDSEAAFQDSDLEKKRLEEQLSHLIGYQVIVDYHNGQGTLKIIFNTFEDLDRLLRLLNPHAISNAL